MPKLTIRFGDKTDKLLTELAEEKGTTKTEIIRRALVTYKYLDEETKDGNKRVSITTKNNETIKDVILP
jgi:predicted transcriptional regulator